MAENLTTIETLDPTPFKHLIMTIGELPTSFVDSMTYYECIAWLANYIQNTVIPAVNNNAEALQEIQDWFKNLDIDEELEKVIKQMIEDGTIYQMLDYDANTETLTLTFTNTGVN